MTSDKPNRSSRAQELELARQASGISQRTLARDLGITQGHYSKVVDGIVRDRKGYVEKGLRLLAADEGDDEDIDHLVRLTVRELRASSGFRSLIDAALKYSRRKEG